MKFFRSPSLLLNFKNGEYTTLDKELIAEYTTNASVLGELLRMKAERKAMMASLNARATDVWEMVEKPH